MSLHIAAPKGEIADRVLLPGDPLRAKFIAETFLENPVCYNNVRGMLGYTGTYKGKRVSVQGTGMGIPSIGIYAHELICDYGVKRLIRTGTCGSLDKNLFPLKTMLIAKAAATDSSMMKGRFGSYVTFPPTADFDLLRSAVENAEKNNINYKVGTVFSCDLFYQDDLKANDTMVEYGVSCVEMECAELFMLGAKYNVQTLGILTVSDLIKEGVGCTSEERQLTFTDMMKLALETV